MSVTPKQLSAYLGIGISLSRQLELPKRPFHLITIVKCNVNGDWWTSSRRLKLDILDGALRRLPNQGPNTGNTNY
ncbi:hypothetical protein TcWFU_002980 [Taenia crassiceps]|uniref:Uncharacterized protein n=1 Tax=Taenia crassiceps TaxID=6207 RepID=A0ABR4QKB0_9CEST